MGLIELGVDIIWHELDDDVRPFREVGITIYNDTDLGLTRTPNFEPNVEWTYPHPTMQRDIDNPPPDKLAARKDFHSIGTFKLGSSPSLIEGTVMYGSGGSSNGNIIEVYFKNPFTIGWSEGNGTASVNIAKHWYDQNYRVYHRVLRNSPKNFEVAAVLRKVHFGNQKRSLRAHSVVMTESPAPVVDGWGIYCCYQGEKQRLWRRWLFDKSNGNNLNEWPDERNDDAVPGSTLGWSPSAVMFKQKLWIFFHGVRDGGIWYNVSDNGRWEGDKSIPNVGLSNSPAATVYRDKIHVVHKGARKDDSLYYCTFDGSNWSQDIQVPNNDPLDSPSLTVFNDKLFCFYHGISPNDSIYWDEFDGKTWKGSQMVPNTQTKSSPSVVTARGKLYLFHTAADSDALWCNVYNGSSWDGDNVFDDIHVSGSPGACVLNDTIYVFHRGGGNHNELWVMPLQV